MYQMVVSDIEIHKESINTDDAVTLFHDLGMTDKEKLFRYRRSSRVNIYELDHYMDYFYGFMVPSTGYLRYYDVIPYADGFMQDIPSYSNSYLQRQSHLYIKDMHKLPLNLRQTIQTQLSMPLWPLVAMV